LVQVQEEERKRDTSVRDLFFYIVSPTGIE